MTRSDRTPEVPVVIAGAGPAGLVVQRDPVGPSSMDRALAPLAMAGLDHDDPQAQQGEAHRRERSIEVGEHGLPLLSRLTC
jgi:hypothetical protein